MATRSQIVEKAYKCLDEVYPDTPLSSDEAEFHIEDFVDDAIRFIGRVAPVRALGEGVDFSTNAEVKDGCIYVNLLNAEFVRLISLQMEDWDLPVTEAFYSDDARYKQQSNHILRGTPKRPIVFICDGGKTLEFYSSTTNKLKKARCFVVDKGMFSIDGTKKYTISYPDTLSGVIAWKTCELVLSAMNDAQGLQFAQNQIQQQLQAL